MSQTEFVIKARARNGRLVESKVRATSEAEALNIVRQQGSLPIAVEPAKTGLNREIHLTKPRVKTKDLAISSRQMATMLASGLPILRCLTVLADQTDNRALKELYLDVRVSVEQGASLSDAMAQHREFPPLMVSMVRAGETGGFLDGSMNQVAEALEADVKLKGRIKAAMTYPIAVGFITIIIVAGLLFFVVPIFAEMFASFDAELPLPTRILIFVSDLLKNPFFIIPAIVIIVGAVWWYRRNKNSPRVRNVVDPLKFRLPVFGPLFTKVALARFTRTLATLLKAGVPILTALDIVGDTSGNVVIARAVTDVQASVREGAGMAVPFSKHDVFPEMVVQMIAVGEDTGALDEMLSKVADFYDQEVTATTEQLTSLIEPLLIIVLGIVIGGIVISLYLPIFALYDVVGQ